MKKHAGKPKGSPVVDSSSEDAGETPVNRHWHPLVALTAKAFRHATADARTGVLAYPSGVHLDLRVSRPLLERSLGFMDRLLRRLDEAGDEGRSEGDGLPGTLQERGDRRRRYSCGST